MQLAQTRGSYDAVFSLGSNCYAANKLAIHQLRHYSGVLDWMVSPSLPGVSKLLRNRFAGFMELPHMSVIGTHAGGLNFLIRDNEYNIMSAHDFPVAYNQLDHWASYPSFKEKVNRRILRFFEKMECSQRILLLRLGGTYEEALELQAELRAIVKNQFHVLLVNHTSNYGVLECHWPLEHICAIEAPLDGEANTDLWNYIFAGVQHISFP
ncbi:DUF1796 family putative cysteine peptidase [Paenibacillus sp. OSY-SE]|uniref:DUF1796 family putative cysteine peptidase n=1 Tax=Paenibacillus sp. OSY-SE TaxID=1196323 RepID=UPI00036EA4AB|nr:DUF1796 family putative cysteine peptidase [Paenibacillus sp. OSY-SE]